MLEAGETQEVVAARMGCSQPVISNLVNRHEETGTVEDRPRSGRPRVTTPNQDHYIVLQHLRDRFRPASRTASETIGLHNNPITPPTVRSRLDEEGLHCHRPNRCPILTAEHRRNRQIWATRHRRWTQRQWSTVVFSDESRFCLHRSDGRQRVYRRAGERNADCCIREVDSFGGANVMVWAGISRNYRTPLVVVEGNLTAQRYVDQILEPHLVPFFTNHPDLSLFQQDGARAHTARLTMNFLEQEDIDVLPWCARSPDLSPIEHLWDELGRRVSRRDNQPINRETLIAALQEEWNNVPQATIANLIGSMRRRCTACQQARGGHTGY